MLPRFSSTSPTLTCSGTAASTISLSTACQGAGRRQNIPTRRRAACYCCPSSSPELAGKGGSPLGNWPKFPRFRPLGDRNGLLLRGALAPLWHNHTVLHGITRTFHTRLLEPSRNMSEDSCPSRSNSFRDASFSFFEGSWESAAAGGAVSPHPHKSCLMPRPLSCNAGNRVSTPRSRAGQATRDAVRILVPRGQ